MTDAEHRSVLATCRGLAAAGYHVAAVAEERFALGHWSRFSKERITLPGPHADPEGYAHRLSQVLDRGRYDVVVPGTELSLLPISEHRQLIEPYSRLGLPPHRVVLRALDKALLHRVAAAVGLAPPPSIACSSREEGVAAALELGFPLLVKPARSVILTAGGMSQRSADVVGDVAGLDDAVAAVGVPFTIQQYIPETTMVSCAGVRADGRLFGVTLARYARTHPLQVGDASLAVTIPMPRSLTEQIEELLARIGWSGIFELELLELGENRFGAIDLNPRPFGWMALAIGAGANIPALWCDHLLQRRSVPLDGARLGIRYRWEDGDARNALAQLRRGRIGAAAAISRPHRRVVHAHFRIDDPAPLIARLLSATGKARRRRARAGAEPGAAL